ncbi:unnamed protein product [Arabidopsis halleri]
METVYGFEINDGYCWRLSETTINASSKSDLTTRMKPVYLDGTLHWLRNDGSIIAFNPETEQARMIPSIFHRESDMKLLFAADDNINRLTLLLGTKETISVYALRKNSKWILARQIKNVSMEDNILERWNMVAYDGQHLVVREMKDRLRVVVPFYDMVVNIKEHHFKGLVHVYDMEANSWRVLGSTWCPSHYDRDFYKFMPSLFPVEEDEQTKVIVASDDQRIRYLSAVMRLIDTTNKVYSILKWNGNGQILSGRSADNGGTWFGISRGGRVAFLGNMTPQAFGNYVAHREEVGQLLSFSLIVADMTLNSMIHIRKPEQEEPDVIIRPVPFGVHSLSIVQGLDSIVPLDLSVFNTFDYMIGGLGNNPLPPLEKIAGIVYNDGEEEDAWFLEMAAHPHFGMQLFGTTSTTALAVERTGRARVFERFRHNGAWHTHDFDFHIRR